MLETYELLDRLELLYPTNSRLSDLRRSYIDKDLSSIFRLVSTENKEDLRKLILENNTWSLWKILIDFCDSQFILTFKNFFVNNTIYDKDCFSRGQLQSKIWLIDELKKLNLDLGTVFLCAGWYGILATMLFESKLKVDKIRSFDIDSSTVDIAETFNKPWVIDEWKFKAVHLDINDIDYNSCKFNVLRKNKTICELIESPDTIINTSCEHINNFNSWYSKLPKNKLIILQANNFTELEEHVNTYKNIEDFDKATPMNEIMLCDSLQLEKYTRFMKIGYK
jgi:hypothetical protein